MTLLGLREVDRTTNENYGYIITIPMYSKIFFKYFY